MKIERIRQLHIHTTAWSFDDDVSLDTEDQRKKYAEEFDEAIRKVKEEAFYEGIDHVLDQLRLINPYGDRNGFLDD